MEWEKFMTFIREGDSDQVRFFGRVTDEDALGSAVSAFANGEGGRIFIGMDINNFHLVGADVSEQWINAFIQNSFSTKVDYSVETIHRHDKVILGLEVREGVQKPYEYKGDVFTFDSEEDVIADQNSSETMIPGTLDSFKEDQDREQADIHSITEELISIRDAEDAYELSPMFVDEDTNSPDQTPDLTGLNHRQKKVLKYLTREDVVKNKVYREMFDVSHKTAHLELTELVGRGFIEQEGSGRSTCYVMKEPVSI